MAKLWKGEKHGKRRSKEYTYPQSEMQLLLQSKQSMKVIQSQGGYRGENALQQKMKRAMKEKKDKSSIVL